MDNSQARPPRKPDELDAKILELLHFDGRMSYSDIARRAGCNEATARKRVERLVAEGTLAVVGVSNPFHLGFQTLVWIGLNVDLNKLNDVAEQLSEMPELSYVACAAGAYDIIATAAFESDARLYDFLANKLGNVEGIRATHTSHLIRLMRRTFAYRPPDPQHARTPVEQRPILMPGDPSQAAPGVSPAQPATDNGPASDPLLGSPVHRLVPS